MLLAEKLSLLTDLENSFKLQLKKVQSEKKQLAKKQAKIEKLYQLQYELTTDPDTADTIGGGCQVHKLTPIVIEICDADEVPSIATEVIEQPTPDKAIALPSIAVPEVIEPPTDESPIVTDEEIAQTTETTPEVQQTATEPSTEPEIKTADVAIAHPTEPAQPTEPNPEPETDTEQVTVQVETESLAAMSIRQLKALAKNAKIKNYGNMTKTQLIEALS